MPDPPLDGLLTPRAAFLAAALIGTVYALVCWWRWG